MGNILFEHNQKAYQAAVQMLTQTGRAAIIHPTGTGKSFIAFQLCADCAEGRVCWLSPSEYIFKTQMEKWDKAGGATPQNIQFFTYARLMRMEEDVLAGIKPEYIVLDEFHRCGAAQWGGGVKRLQEMYPDAKVLGLSATNIRYLDSRRDMAWELFGGNVASELTLGAAVATGILPAPKYVLSVYSYRKELERYETRVRQARNKAVRDAVERELEALRRALEKADGLPEVFARHMQAGSVACGRLAHSGRTRPGMTAEGKPGQPGGYGKYIVFCANYEHLLSMRELATEWFAKVDPTPHIYTVYSDAPETSAEFAAFKADESQHLKLLYCIDMLNEGIHVAGVDGVVLLRPTVSPTVYKQQVGRALAAGGEKTPVIFDIVMNIENLCSIGAIEEELKETVFALRGEGREGEIVTEHFRVVDEVADCRVLFARLNQTLNASWDAMYAMAEEYYKIHGNLEVPAAHTTLDGYSLGAWVATQRKVYNKRTAGCLSEEQIRRLEAVGMRWEGVQEAAWERNFAEAKKYYKEYGDLDIPADFVTEGGCRLGRWVRRQRELYQRLNLGQRIPAGQHVPDNRQAMGQDEGLAEPPGGSKGAGRHLAAGAAGKERDMSVSGRQGIHAEHVKRLTQIGMIWENDDPWARRFELARQYYEEHGDLEVPADYVVEGVWLDRWLREQKAKLREENGIAGGGAKASIKERKPLTREQKENLASVGITSCLTRGELSWQQQYGEAEKFYREHGNLSIPKRYVGKNGKNLGIWLQRQRTGRRRGFLSTEQVALLDRIGMVWKPDIPWETGISHAEEYFRENGHLAVPNHYVCADGYRLGKWISNQRQAYKQENGKGLAAEQIRRLEEIGMLWRAGEKSHRR